MDKPIPELVEGPAIRQAQCLFLFEHVLIFLEIKL